MKYSKKKAIYYLTFNGVYNNNNGIGTQTKLILEFIDKHYQDIADIYSDFTFNIITPVFNIKSTQDYSLQDLEYATNIVKNTSGCIFYCPYEHLSDQFWDVESWKTMSDSAAAIILNDSEKYSNTLVITVDPPFLHTPIILEKAKGNMDLEIKSLVLLYSSSFIHDKNEISLKRLEWEYSGLNFARFSKNIMIGDVCNFMKQHLTKEYGVPEEKFIPFISSILIESQTFIPLSSKEIISNLQNFGVPTDKDIILSFGRANWIKGFDILLNEYKNIKIKPHLVLIAVKTSERDDQLINDYKKIIKENEIECTLITSYTRELPRALSQWHKTKIVVCPSRGEPFSNIPLEVSLWAMESGPILICSNIDGYTEQIEDGENGYLFDLNKKNNLSEKINKVFSLNEFEIKNIRTKAYNKVIKERNYFVNFLSMLEKVW